MWPAINMGRYHFYNKSLNDYCFQDEDLGLSTDESEPSQIWLHMQLTWKQNSIVWFTQFDYGERLIHHISTQHVWSHKVHPHVELFVLHFTLCFVKALWWGVTRFALPHVHTYMFCPYVISTLHCLLEKLQWELSKDTFLVQFFSQLCS